MKAPGVSARKRKCRLPPAGSSRTTVGSRERSVEIDRVRIAPPFTSVTSTHRLDARELPGPATSFERPSHSGHRGDLEISSPEPDRVVMLGSAPWAAESRHANAARSWSLAALRSTAHPAIPASGSCRGRGVATAEEHPALQGQSTARCSIQRCRRRARIATTRKIASTPADVLREETRGVPESSLPGGAAWRSPSVRSSPSVPVSSPEVSRRRSPDIGERTHSPWETTRRRSSPRPAMASPRTSVQANVYRRDPPSTAGRAGLARSVPPDVSG